MAYSTTNPPALLFLTVTNNGPIQVWGYSSADTASSIYGSGTGGYFTNAGNLGMKVGDLIIIKDTTTPLVTSAQVLSVGTTGNGVANISNPVTLGAAT